MKTFVIAEAGSNHDGKLEQAFELVDAAKHAGCSAVKFQLFKSDSLYSLDTPNFAGYEDINSLMKSLELPREWVHDIKKYCDDKQIEFMATPFDEEAVKMLCDIGVKRMKVAGFESTDPRFVDMVAQAGLPMIISAGIGSSINSLPQLVGICHANNNRDITILHCNNAYPTPQRDINLLTMKKMKKYLRKQGAKVGLSDHTESTLTPALAVAAGATVIEKHFTLSKELPGPDHKFALEPHELKDMIEKILIAEESLGQKTTLYTSSEENFSQAQRSLSAKTDISAGDFLTKENLTTRRPFTEGSIAASYYFDIIGNAKVSQDIPAGSIIKMEHIGE